MARSFFWNLKLYTQNNCNNRDWIFVWLALSNFNFYFKKEKKEKKEKGQKSRLGIKNPVVPTYSNLLCVAHTQPTWLMVLWQLTRLCFCDNWLVFLLPSPLSSFLLLHTHTLSVCYTAPQKLNSSLLISFCVCYGRTRESCEVHRIARIASFWRNCLLGADC